MPPLNRAAFGVWFALSLFACGGDAETLLILDLRTDLVAGVEFDRVDTGVTGAAHPETSLFVAASDRFSEGSRIAEIAGIEQGDRTAVVRLFLQGSPVTSRRLNFRMTKTVALTVVITRDCRGVNCDSGDVAAGACLAGRCVDDRCAPETPEFCPIDGCG